MSARFRIRTKEGQELSFASHEIFAEFVRSGDLSPDDVVYDAETREWSSAQTHPVVLQIQLEGEGASGPLDDRELAGGAEAAGTDAANQDMRPAEKRRADDESGAAGIDLGLDLAPSGMTPEEQAAAFVAQMEAERATERALEEDLPGFTMERGSSSFVENLSPPPAAADPKPPKGERTHRRREALMAPEIPERRRPDPPHRREGPTAVPAPARKRSGGGRAATRLAPFALLAAVAVAAGVYFGPELMTPGAEGMGESEAEPGVEPPPAEIPSTEEAVRARARERYLTSTQAALRGLEQIPEVWLRGSYLAEPSDYPHVREVWERYATTIRDVRAGEDERYRDAYLRALDDARVVEGGARTLRLSSALSAFQADGARRTAHYQRVEALALTAIQGHDALAEAEGTIMYQPATGPALSADPVIEAVGRTAESQALLNRVLDSILALLHAERGPGESRNVREWVWDGLLDAVTG